MAIAAKLKKYLDSNKVKYKALKHKLAYTAQEIAAAQEVPGKQVIKSVLVKAGDKFVLAVLPAIHLIDAKKLKTVLKCKSIKIATEKDFLTSSITSSGFICLIHFSIALKPSSSM